jgi:serine phosphatase RsbU (regulator of sigma subunit)
VTGHGLESGVLTIMVQTAVRTLLENNETDLKRFIETINRTIYGNLQRMDCDKNITLSLLDYKDGVLTLCGQHEEVILARHNAPIECIDTIDLGFPIGLEQEISAFVDKIQISLNPGDVVVLYTDGITEAENAGGDLFGLERLCATIEIVKTLTAEQICQSILRELRQHIGQHIVHDDITLLVLKRK